MAQRRYSKRVTITLYSDGADEPESVEIAEQRWALQPHLVAFCDIGPFPVSRLDAGAVEAASVGSVMWLLEDLTEGAQMRMI